MNKTKIQLLIDEMQKRTANKKAAAERREKINQQLWTYYEYANPETLRVKLWYYVISQERERN